MILNRASVEKGARFQSLRNARVDEPLNKFPSGAPTEGDVRPLIPPHILPDPWKGAPLTELTQREILPFRNLPTIFKFPGNGLPRFPNGPLRRETPVSGAFFYTFPSKSPVNDPPSMFPIWLAVEGGASSPEPTVYSFIYRTSVRFPSKEPSHEKRGKHLVTVQGAPRGLKTYIKWVAACFH
jgi:hypothetical protein